MLMFDIVAVKISIYLQTERYAFFAAVFTSRKLGADTVHLYREQCSRSCCKKLLKLDFTLMNALVLLVGSHKNSSIVPIGSVFTLKTL